MGDTHLSSLVINGSLTVGETIGMTGGFTASADSAMSTDKKIQLRDTGLYIHSSQDGQLDIIADTKVMLTAPVVGITGDQEITGQFRMDQMMFYDDFMEGSNALASTVISKAHWTGGGTSGTQAIISGANGIMELDTTSTASRSSSLTFTNANFDTNKAPALEARLKTDLLTHRKIEFGWYADANDCLMFRFDTEVDAGNIYLISENNNEGEISTDTGADLTADTYITFRIEINSDETFSAYINGSVVAGSHSGTIRALTTLKPRFYIDNKDQAQSNKLYIDYVKIWQSRD